MADSTHGIQVFDAAGVPKEEAAGWTDGWKMVLAPFGKAAGGTNRDG